MKKVTLLLAVVFIAISSNAQKIQYGIKSGINLSTITGTDAGGAKSKVGFFAGGLVDFKLSNGFIIQPELFYNSLGFKADEYGTRLMVNINYLSLPVLLKMAKDDLFFESGPQLSFLLSANGEALGQSGSVKELFKSTDLSWIFGAGYLTKMNLGINIRYQLGLTKIASIGSSIKNSAFQFGVFYMLGGK